MPEEIQAPAQPKTIPQPSAPARRAVDITSKPNISPQQKEPVPKPSQPVEEPTKDPEAPLKKYQSNTPWGAISIAVFVAFILIALSIFVQLQQL